MFPQIFGKYVLERELAAGGMARVYLATLRGAGGFEKRLVVKQIRPELASDHAFVQRFVEEAKTAVELSHPNIVPVYELGVEQGVYYIAMEFCAGVTLAEVLARTGKLSPEEGAAVGVEICRALDYAHRRAGIVHRDVTPRNVLLDEEGAVRLIDFGIALPVAQDDSGKTEVFGSPGHMPPEQIAGKPLTPATDVFAVAALLVEAWTGRAPFRRATARESHAALYEPRPPIESDEPRLEPLSALIERALAHDPKERPAGAELFARPLRDFLRTVDSGDVARRLGERVRRASRDARRSGTASVHTPASHSPSAGAALAAPLTRTFAARDEVQAWTRRLEPTSDTSAPNRVSTPPPKADTGPATRKLPSLPPEPDPAAARDAELPRVEPSPDSAGANDTPPQAVAPRPTPPPTRSWRALGPLVALASVALGALWFARARPEPPRPIHTPRAVAPSQPARAEPNTPLPTATTAPLASSVAPVSSIAPTAAAPIAAAPSAKTTPRAAPSAALPTGTLRLTADPPASVSVVGTGKHQSLRTPVRELRVPAGSYTVTFRSETYDVPVVARVIVEQGIHRSVHADFREADPRVTVR